MHINLPERGTTQDSVLVVSKTDTRIFDNNFYQLDSGTKVEVEQSTNVLVLYAITVLTFCDIMKLFFQNLSSQKKIVANKNCREIMKLLFS